MNKHAQEPHWPLPSRSKERVSQLFGEHRVIVVQPGPVYSRYRQVCEFRAPNLAQHLNVTRRVARTGRPVAADID